MASENLEDNKSEHEAPPLQQTDELDGKPETKDEENCSKQQEAHKVEEVELQNQQLPDKEVVSSLKPDSEGDNRDDKGAGKLEEGDQPILEQAQEEQDTGAGADDDDDDDDKNIQEKSEESVEDEDEGDHEGDSEDALSEDEDENENEKENIGKEVKESPVKSMNDSSEKKVRRDSILKEPVTPSIERPARERKTVERYSVPSPGRYGRSSASKGLSIEKGRGTKLMDIPNVAFKLSKRKADDNLQVLHTILFGKKAKVQTMKRNISQFSGYVWVENEIKQRSKVKEKLDKCVKEKLIDFCDVLNIPINKASVKKEELSAKLLEFLELPHATTDILLADKEQKVKKRRRSTPGKMVGSGESAEGSAKKQKSQLARKRKQTSEVEEDEEDDKVQTSNEKDDSHDDKEDVTAWKDESDEENKSPEKISSPSRSSKKARKDDLGSKSSERASSTKKATVKSAKSVAAPTKKSSSSTSKKGDSGKIIGSPSKSKSKSKKHKDEESKPTKEKSTGKKLSSKSPAKAEEQGKGKNSKKVKREPSRQEMHAVVVNILKQVDFNTATLSDILRQLGTHFGVDLMRRKAEVKDIITDVINNMSDEEEEEEEEAEDDGGASDDAKKDDCEDKDDDA